MRDPSSQYRVQSVPVTSSLQKRLGGYLVEAGLLTPAQVDVALNDQKMTGMLFGEILATRGWVKQQTIDYLMKKVIEPERQAMERGQVRKLAGQVEPGVNRQPEPRAAQASGMPPTKPGLAETQKAAMRRDGPISKPLPSVGASDDDVSWVG